MADDGRLTPKQGEFVRALLTERDTRAAAAAVSIAERTAYRWVSLPEVQAAIVAAEGEALEGVTRGLLRLAGDAVQTLSDAMGDQDATTAARVRAADVVLARLLQLRELVTFEERLAALEAHVMGQEGT